MATSRNEHTGDLLKSKPNSKEYSSNYDQIFGDKPPQRGRYKQDRETGDFIPISEWNKKYAEAPRERGPMFFLNHFEAYQSPVTGEVIQNKRQARYDLDKTGCRIYEGMESEQREVDRQTAYKEQQFEQAIEQTLEETAHEIDHGYREVAEDPAGINFTFGED